jgi:hypothetical protein
VISDPGQQSRRPAKGRGDPEGTPVEGLDADDPGIASSRQPIQEAADEVTRKQVEKQGQT